MDLNQYIPSAAHVHISDDEGCPDRRGFLKPDKYACHERRLHNLMEAGYDGTVSLEVDGPPDTQLCVRSCYFLKKVLNC